MRDRCERFAPSALRVRLGGRSAIAAVAMCRGARAGAWCPRRRFAEESSIRAGAPPRNPGRRQGQAREARQEQGRGRSEAGGSRKRRVVVTGLGLVTPVGLDVNSTWGVAERRPGGVGPISLFDAAHFRPGSRPR